MIKDQWLEEFIRVRKQNSEFNCQTLSAQLAQRSKQKIGPDNSIASVFQQSSMRELMRRISFEQGYQSCLRDLEYLLSTSNERPSDEADQRTEEENKS